MKEELWSVDYETEAIVDGSATLPRPVGLAIEEPDGTSRYYAFAHPTDNNCTEDEAKAALRAIWDKPFVGQNILGFDIPIAEYWWGFPPRDPLLSHDTMYEAYLLDPHAESLSLKNLCLDWLGIPPTDQQVMYDWIMANVPECRSRKKAGAYISKAPGGMVGDYAESDTYMARALHEYCYPKLQEMLAPYDRERVLAPILADMRLRGIRIDVERLKADYRTAMDKLHNLDMLVRDRLKAPNLNPGSDQELVAALKGAGYSGFLTTPTGRDSANKESLEAVLSTDPELQSMLRSRATYATLTGTFMKSWLELAEMNGGTINPTYNSVRNPEGYGTRTGRLSSSNPNGQNLPTDLGTDHFGDHFPEMRSYCLPDEGMVWLTADLRSQEPRLTAHFEDGRLMEAYVNDPDLDPYIFVRDLVGGDTTRKESKVVFLGLVYSMGAASLAAKLGCSNERATALRNAIRAALPDVNRLDRDCKKRFQLGLPIRTLGGRYCFCEPPKNGRSWEYKALNLLIQGSAADQTKEMIIYTAEHLPPGARIVSTVHDEVSVSCRSEDVELVSSVLLAGANELPCDVPMLISVGVGGSYAEATRK